MRDYVVDNSVGAQAASGAAGAGKQAAMVAPNQLCIQDADAVAGVGGGGASGDAGRREKRKGEDGEVSGSEEEEGGDKVDDPGAERRTGRRVYSLSTRGIATGSVLASNISILKSRNITFYVLRPPGSVVLLF